MRVRGFRVVAVAVGVLGACITVEGGNNTNRKAPGNGSTGAGVTVGLGDVAVSTDGRFFLSERDDELMIGSAASCDTRGTGIFEPSRLGFAPNADVAYVSSKRQQQVVAVRLSTREVLWRLDTLVTEDDKPELRVAPDGRHLLVVQWRSIDVVDALTGQVVQRKAMPREIVDVDFLGGDELAVTLTHTWVVTGENPRAETLIELWSIAGGPMEEISVPNCSERLSVGPAPETVAPAPRLAAFWSRQSAVAHAPARLDAPLGLAMKPARYAFLAPTRCRFDPISVIDLANRRFVENLPGFGPVTLSPDGSTAIGFLEPGASGGDFYALMFINTQTLEWTSIAVGHVLPRFTITPDGSVLLVDDDGLTENGTQILDVAERRFRPVIGPKVGLDDFALSTDSRMAWIVSGGDLFALYVQGGTVEKRPLPYVVKTLNISPDDAVLYLHDTSQTVHLYEPQNLKQRCQVNPAPQSP